MNDFSHFKPATKERELSNHEWAKEVRARVADLNELLDEAVSRDVIVTGTIAMTGCCYVGGDNHLKPMPTVMMTLSERI